MPLHNSFNRNSRHNQAANAILKNLSTGTPPSRRELAFIMSRASQSAPDPQIVRWLVNTTTFQLHVLYRGGVPTWKLSKIDQDQPVAIWSIVTEDPEQIYQLLLKRIIPTEGTDSEEQRSPGQQVPIVGAVFLDRYRIIESIGHGGMGRIFRAADLVMNRPVALKVLHTYLLEEEASRRRFEREMEACINLKHPNVVSVYDYGYTPEAVPYMVMEYLDGETLEEYVCTRDPMSIGEFTRIFTQICGALKQAHSKQIIHRDVKPSNIMLIKQSDNEHLAKLLDFGIAKMVDRNSAVTKTGEIIGSLFYMSPEQCQNERLDARSDIYSLGCVMFEAVSGIRPFQGDTPLNTMMMQIHNDPMPFSTLREDILVPAEIERIIFRTLQKNPDDRYQSVDDVLNVLQAFAQHHPDIIKEDSIRMGPGSEESIELLSVQSEQELLDETALAEMLDLPLSPGLELLIKAGLIEADDANVVSVFKQLHGGNEFRYLRELGCIDDRVYRLIKECQAFSERFQWSLEQSILTLKYCNSKGLTLEEALAELS